MGHSHKSITYTSIEFGIHLIKIRSTYIVEGQHIFVLMLVVVGSKLKTKS